MENKFIIKCSCGWSRLSTGISESLKDLSEVKKCSKCGSPRTFRCPNCKGLAKQFRIKSK